MQRLAAPGRCRGAAPLACVQMESCPGSGGPAGRPGWRSRLRLTRTLRERLIACDPIVWDGIPWAGWDGMQGGRIDPLWPNSQHQPDRPRMGCSWSSPPRANGHRSGPTQRFCCASESPISIWHYEYGVLIRFTGSPVQRACNSNGPPSALVRSAHPLPRNGCRNRGTLVRSRAGQPGQG